MFLSTTKRILGHGSFSAGYAKADEFLRLSAVLHSILMHDIARRDIFKFILAQNYEKSNRKRIGFPCFPSFFSEA